MEYSKSLLPFLALFSCVFPVATGLTETVLSTFIYTHHGERTPMIRGDSPHLTPLGARQAWQAGVNMRSRYIQPTGTDESTFIVRDISPVILDNSEINILASTDEFATSSAQAFMQGLYPPLTVGQNYSVIHGESDLANGTNILAPLGGYQYPNVVAASSYDLRSIYVKGTDNCPQYNADMKKYFNSSRYLLGLQSSTDLYNRLKEPLLNGVFNDEAVGYFDAYYIWDYLSYGYVHNQTIRTKLSTEDYTAVRLLAGNWMLDMYANTTDGEVGQQHILDIGGRTLASYILQSFLYSIQNKGRFNKMNLVFGDYIPMMSFAALAQLMTEKTGAFFYAPAPGSSLIFELFTYQPQTPNGGYPKTSDMFVRFLYQNGTDEYSRLIEYPLFGASPSQSMMSYSDFISSMSGIAISDTNDWCRSCGSYSVFCSEEDSQSGSSSSRGLRPAVAGVIGAIAALAFIALVIALVMLLGGVRLHRQPKRRSELGGFKGNEKLASDQDLTIPKGGAGVTVNEEPRGHERVGSWELKEPVNIQSMQSGIDTEVFGRGKQGLNHDDTTVDPYGIPVRPRDAF